MPLKNDQIILDPVMDIVAAGKLKEQLVSMIDEIGKVTIDGNKVERIMTPCIQLLVVADQELMKNQSGIKMINASDEMVNSLTDIGLEENYKKWSS